jgi:hypothetical protein
VIYDAPRSVAGTKDDMPDQVIIEVRAKKRTARNRPTQAVRGGRQQVQEGYESGHHADEPADHGRAGRACSLPKSPPSASTQSGRSRTPCPSAVEISIGLGDYHYREGDYERSSA